MGWETICANTWEGNSQGRKENLVVNSLEEVLAHQSVVPELALHT